MACQIVRRRLRCVRRCNECSWAGKIDIHDPETMELGEAGELRTEEWYTVSGDGVCASVREVPCKYSRVRNHPLDIYRYILPSLSLQI